MTFDLSFPCLCGFHCDQFSHDRFASSPLHLHPRLLAWILACLLTLAVTTTLVLAFLLLAKATMLGPKAEVRLLLDMAVLLDSKEHQISEGILDMWQN